MPRYKILSFLEAFGGFATLIYALGKWAVAIVEKKLIESSLIKQFYQVEKPASKKDADVETQLDSKGSDKPPSGGDPDNQTNQRPKRKQTVLERENGHLQRESQQIREQSVAYTENHGPRTKNGKHDHCEQRKLQSWSSRVVL